MTRDNMFIKNCEMKDNWYYPCQLALSHYSFCINNVVHYEMARSICYQVQHNDCNKSSFKSFSHPGSKKNYKTWRSISVFKSLSCFPHLFRGALHSDWVISGSTRGNLPLILTQLLYRKLQTRPWQKTEKEKLQKMLLVVTYVFPSLL